MTSSAVPVLVNPRAGSGGERSVDRIEQALARRGARAEVRAVAVERLRQELLGLVQVGAPVVGVAGGDGTLLTAAGALVGTSTALLPIPAGTLNHFARRTGMKSLDDVAEVLANGTVRRFPVGVVDDRVFLNTATFGLYADVVRHREKLRRWLGKWPAAAVGFATRVAGLRQVELTVEADGQRLHRRTPLVWIGIGWGSFPIVYEADDSGRAPQLEIVVLRPGGRLGAVGLLARLSIAIRRGVRPTDDPALEFLHARHALIHAERPIGTTLDGEIDRLATPVFAGIQAESLSILTLS